MQGRGVKNVLQNLKCLNLFEIQIKSINSNKVNSKCLNLNDYKFKTSRYNYRSTYMKPMVTTNQKPTIDTQKLLRKEHKHNSKENQQTTKQETKRRRKSREKLKQNKTKL